MATLLWSAEVLEDVFNVSPTCSLSQPIAGVRMDSRTLGAGDLFFAIQGEKRDGHDFVEQAFERGAGAAVIARAQVQRFKESFLSRHACFIVEDVLVALENLGKAGRSRSRAQFVGITGSVGKTTTKEILRLMCSAFGSVHASVQSYNNHWGVPLTLANLPRETDFAIIEMGMNHAGELRHLSAMARPHVGIITTIAPSHLAAFSDLSEVMRAKAEIFEHVEAGGVILLPRDSDFFDSLYRLAKASKATHFLSFGTHPAADVKLEKVQTTPSGTELDAVLLGRPLHYRLTAVGEHMAYNSLICLGVASALKLKDEQAAQKLSEFQPLEGRGQQMQFRVGAGLFTLIDESYNANPASMAAALAVLQNSPMEGKGRRIVVLGDMLELGHKSALYHQTLMEKIARSNIDLVFAVGPEMQLPFARLPEQKKGAWLPEVLGMQEKILPVLQPGDILMVKSSKGIQLSKLVGGLKKQFAGS